MRPRLPLVLLIATCALLVLALPAWAQTVTITAEGVEPASLAVEVGDTVAFHNDTGADVRIFDDAGRWDSGSLAADEVFSIAFETAGTVTYSSSDGSFSGQIVVDGAGAAPASEPEASAPPEAQATGAESPIVADQLADTGAPVALLAALSVLLLGAGIVLIRRA